MASGHAILRGVRVEHKENNHIRVIPLPIFTFIFYLLVSQHKEVKKRIIPLFILFLCHNKVAGHKSRHLVKNDPFTSLG